MNSRFLIILAVIVAVLGGVFFFTRSDSSQTTSTDQNAGSNHIVGKGTANVTLVEYGDFQCPACATYFPVVEQVKEKYKDQITFQFRHFPLVQIHPNAMIASRAAEAAGNQDKFWEMYEVLYAQQNTWKSSDNAAGIFEDYASQLGLNVDQFKADVAAQATLDTINADVRLGQEAGVNSTPSFILNGQKLEGLAPSVESFSQVIDEAIKNQAASNTQQ